MAYMHRETFEILQGSNIDNYIDDFFEVDDLIALPIQALNRKGYITRFCCCGHPFEKIDEVFSAEEVSVENSPFIGTFKVEEIENKEYPEHKYRILQRDRPNRGGYISFAKDISLPPLPEGFFIDDEDEDCLIRAVALDENGEIAKEQPEETLTVTWYYDDDTPVYDYLAEVVEDMRDLYEWALGLPDFSEWKRETVEATPGKGEPT